MFPRFRSSWHRSRDRIWLGPELWANPIQDWRVQSGRLECVNAESGRNVQMLTWSVGPDAFEFSAGVRLGLIDGTPLAEGAGSAGFHLGINGVLKDYRHSQIFGKGLSAGLTRTGGLFIGDGTQAARGAVDLSRPAVDLRLNVTPAGGAYDVLLSVLDPATNRVLGEMERLALPAAQLQVNVGLIANVERLRRLPQQGAAKLMGRLGRCLRARRRRKSA